MPTQRMQLRRTVVQFAAFLHYLQNYQPAANEVSRDDLLNFWRQFDLVAVIADPAAIPEIDAWHNVSTAAAALGFRVWPGFFLRPPSLAHYFQESFWQSVAGNLDIVAGLRMPGDPWILLDLENFTGTQQEPSLANIGFWNSVPGASVAGLRAAMQPLIQALLSTDVALAVMPASAASGEDLLHIAETLGRDRMEFWTQGSHFQLAQKYFRSPRVDWPEEAAAFLSTMTALHSRVPGAVVRPGVYDLERRWSTPLRRELHRFGPVAPWSFDFTRGDQVLNGVRMLGHPGYVRGTLASSNSPQRGRLNDVQHVWPMQPLQNSVPPEFDCGPGFQDTAFEGATGVPMVLFPIGPGAQPAGYVHPLHADGVPISKAPPPLTGMPLRAAEVLQGAFTLDATFQLPECTSPLSAGTVEELPVFGATASNAVDWQVVCRRSVTSQGESCALVLIVYQGSQRQPSSSATTAPFYREFVVLENPPRGRDIRLLVGRDGAGAAGWRYHVCEAGAVPGSPVLVESQLRPYNHLLVGAGINHQRFISPRVNELIPHPGLLLRQVWALYGRLLDSDEIAYLQSLIPPADPRRPFLPRYWPYGVGEDHRVANLGTVASTGLPAPGTGRNFLDVSGIPSAGGKGHVAFNGTWQRGSATMVPGIWSGPPGAPVLIYAEATVFRSFSGGPHPVNATGRTAFAASLIESGATAATAANDSGLWITGTAGAALLAREGNPAPGTAAGTLFGEFLQSPALNDGGVSAFHAALTGPQVNLTNAEGIWRGEPGALTLAARTGDAAPGAGGAAFAQLGSPSLNATGNLLFHARLSTNATGLWVGKPGFLKLVGMTDQQAPGLPPGVEFDQLTDDNSRTQHVIDKKSRVAFVAQLRHTPAGTESGIWVLDHNQQPSLKLLARAGDAAPGVSGAVFQSFTSPVLNGSGSVAFFAFTSPSAGAPVSGGGIWRRAPGGALTKIVHTGDPAPEAGTGVTFSLLSNAQFQPLLAQNGSGDFVFAATLAGQGVTAQNDYSLWRISPSGVFRLLARTGMTWIPYFGDTASRIIAGIQLAGGNGGEDGRPCGLSGNGAITFGLSFTDGSTAVVQRPRP